MAKEQPRTEPLIVASKMKAAVKGKEMMSLSEAIEAVSDHVYRILDAAVERAKANRRATVRAQDL